MPEITRDLIRKRSEHNEGMITTLEEISLHQEEIESLNEVLGATCRKLKILYLQNNIIPQMENLTHLKELEYLNLALNNITKIEGLQNCEFLKKLDLTVNFVDVDELESSIDHLVSRDRFREFYMMGNPCQVDWPGFESYVIAKLPQIDTLDGKEITRSMRIIATQKLPHLESELRQLAVIKRREKAYKLAEKEKIAAAKMKRDAEIEANNNGQAVEVTDGSDDDEGVLRNEKGQEMTENTPEARIEIYAELAKQKKEKEDRENLNKPKKRDYEKEHQDTLNDIRKKEESIPEDEIKQKNEAGLTFTWDEETKKGAVILEVYVQRYLDSSLIDVDIHPNYISIIIKSKLLRLRLPCEVQVSESKCQRSKTTGHLMVTMPKLNQKDTSVNFVKIEPKKTVNPAKAALAAERVKKTAKAPSIHELMMQEALAGGLSSSNSSNSNRSKEKPEFLEIGGRLNATKVKSTDYTSIVRKPQAASEDAEPATVFDTSTLNKALISEIDE